MRRFLAFAMILALTAPHVSAQRAGTITGGFRIAYPTGTGFSLAWYPVDRAAVEVRALFFAAPHIVTGMYGAGVRVHPAGDDRIFASMLYARTLFGAAGMRGARVQHWQDVLGAVGYRFAGSHTESIAAGAALRLSHRSTLTPPDSARTAQPVTSALGYPRLRLHLEIGSEQRM